MSVTTAPVPWSELRRAGAAAVAAALAADVRMCAAESVTGGLVCAAVTEVPGCSAVFPGGLVTYEVAAKAGLLGVPAALLERHGPVHPEVALAMAARAAGALAAEVAVATTGVAGPEPHGGHRPGTVELGWRTAAGAGAIQAWFPGDRAAIRAAAALAALKILTECARAGTVRAASLTGPGEFRDYVDGRE